LARLTRLQDAYKDQVAFLFVAIKDAGHPDEDLPTQALQHLRKDKTPEGRLRLVRQGLETYRIFFPGLLDEDGQVEQAYGAYPQRLVIVGEDGLIAFDGGWGSDGGPSPWNLELVERHLCTTLLGMTFPPPHWAMP
jgi:hypothetical protein